MYLFVVTGHTRQSSKSGLTFLSLWKNEQKVDSAIWDKESTNRSVNAIIDHCVLGITCPDLANTEHYSILKICTTVLIIFGKPNLYHTLLFVLFLFDVIPIVHSWNDVIRMLTLFPCFFNMPTSLLECTDDEKNGDQWNSWILPNQFSQSSNSSYISQNLISRKRAKKREKLYS